MAQATTKELTTLPIGRLGLVSLESSRDLGNKVDNWLVHNQEGTGATMTGNQIQLTMPTSGYQIHSAKVKKGNMVLQIIVPISY